MSRYHGDLLSVLRCAWIFVIISWGRPTIERAFKLALHVPPNIYHPLRLIPIFKLELSEIAPCRLLLLLSMALNHRFGENVFAFRCGSGDNYWLKDLEPPKTIL